MKIKIWSAGMTLINADAENQEAPIRSILAKVAAGEAHPGWILENILIAVDADKSNISHDTYGVVAKDDGTELWRGWLTGDPDAPPPAGAELTTEPGTVRLDAAVLHREVKRLSAALETVAAGAQAAIDEPTTGSLDKVWVLETALRGLGYDIPDGYEGDGIPFATSRVKPATATTSALRNGKKLSIALDALRDIRGAGSVAHSKAQAALDRIAALGPDLAEILQLADDGDPDTGRHPSNCRCQFCREDEREEQAREDRESADDAVGLDDEDGYPDSEDDMDRLAYQRNGDDERDDQ